METLALITGPGTVSLFFLLKLKIKAFFFPLKKKKNPESLAVKFTCLRVVFKVSYKLIPKDTHYIIQLNIAFNYCY